MSFHLFYERPTEDAVAGLVLDLSHQQFFRDWEQETQGTKIHAYKRKIPYAAVHFNYGEAHLMTLELSPPETQQVIDSFFTHFEPIGFCDGVGILLGDVVRGYSFWNIFDWYDIPHVPFNDVWKYRS